MDLKEIVKQIIKSNNYLTLATTNGRQPWANAVFYAVDEDYNFYFRSYKDSLHVQNIMQNPNVAVTIFDSNQPLGMGEGVQIKAQCFEVLGEELQKALDILSKRYSLGSSKTPNPNLHVYKIVPEQFYFRNKQSNGEDRVEVRIN